MALYKYSFHLINCIKLKSSVEKKYSTVDNSYISVLEGVMVLVTEERQGRRDETKEALSGSTSELSGRAEAVCWRGRVLWRRLNTRHEIHKSFPALLSCFDINR